MKHARLPATIFVFLLASAAEPGAIAIGQAQDRPAAAPSNPVAAQSLEQLSTILDRPLFSPSRRPPAPPPAPPPIVQAAEPPAPPPPPPNLVLFGVVMDGEGARAVVRAGADRKLVRAQIGDEIDGLQGLDLQAGSKRLLQIFGLTDVPVLVHRCIRDSTNDAEAGQHSGRHGLAFHGRKHV